MKNLRSRARQLRASVFSISPRKLTLCAPCPIAARQLVLNAVASVGRVLGTRPEAGSTENAKKIELLLGQRQDRRSGDRQMQNSYRDFPRGIGDNRRLGKKTKESHSNSGFGRKQLQHQLNRLSRPTRVEEVLFEEQEFAAPTLPTTVVAENILRVDAERIDNVLNLVGELIIGKSMLQQALNEFAKRYPQGSHPRTLRRRHGFSGAGAERFAAFGHESSHGYRSSNSSGAFPAWSATFPAFAAEKWNS